MAATPTADQLNNPGGSNAAEIQPAQARPPYL